MQGKQQTVGARLSSAVPYITFGGCVADIGTDHAYLPIYLMQKGIISRSVACDINEGPIESARVHIAEAGFSDRIVTLHTDGLHGVEPYAPDDVLIFGMGGELIVKILSEAPWIQNERIGLILQPMSRASALRRWLCENGFSIVGEALSYEEKYYQTIAARYTGEISVYTDVELAIGRFNIDTRPLLFDGFLRHEIAVLDKILAGKARSEDADATAERQLKKCMEELL